MMAVYEIHYGRPRLLPAAPQKKKAVIVLFRASTHAGVSGQGVILISRLSLSLIVLSICAMRKERKK